MVGEGDFFYQDTRNTMGESGLVSLFDGVLWLIKIP